MTAPTFAITSIGADRPGIVAAVTGVLVARGCNLEDTAMSILGGQFAIVMVVAAPEGTGAADLEAALVEGTAGLELTTFVRPIAEPAPDAAPDRGGIPTWTVVVYGPDQPGIVHLVASALADLGVNLLDVTTRVSGGQAGLYSMVMEVQPPDGLDIDTADAALEAVAAGQGLTIHLAPEDADLL